MLLGDAGAWLPHFRNLSEKLLSAVNEVWPDCLAPLVMIKGPLTLENPITDHLVLALIRSRKLPGRLVPQYALLTERPDGTAHLSSEIDFVLTIGEDEAVYLACECKRLNVPFKSGKKTLASEYLEEGLRRFTEGKYAPMMPCAMMFGYVMDRNIGSARLALGHALKMKQNNLHLSALPVANDDNPFSTHHQRATSDKIEVVHNLLAWP